MPAIVEAKRREERLSTGYSDGVCYVREMRCVGRIGPGLLGIETRTFYADGREDVTREEVKEEQVG